MSKRIPADVTAVSMTEFKQQMGRIAEDIARYDSTLIVENHGKPKLMVVSAERGLRMAALADREDRRKALQELRALLRDMSEQGPKLSDDEASEVASQILREYRAEQRAQPAGEPD